MATYDNDELLALCHALLPDDRSLSEVVRLAVEQPAVYWATVQPHQQLQHTEQDGDPPTDVPWLALLNGLLERDQLALLDWRARPDEVIEQMDRLLRDRPPETERWSWMDDVEWDQASTEEFLEAIRRQLQKHHALLVYFPLDSDMYAVAVIDEDRFPALQQHAELTGYGSLERDLSGDEETLPGSEDEL